MVMAAVAAVARVAILALEAVVILPGIMVPLELLGVGLAAVALVATACVCCTQLVNLVAAAVAGFPFLAEALLEQVAFLATETLAAAVGGPAELRVLAPEDRLMVPLAADMVAVAAEAAVVLT